MENSNKIKILHITQVAGGIETYLEQIFKHIDREKFELILAFPIERSSIVKLVDKYNITNYPICLKWQISPIDDIKSIVSIIKLVKKIKPDIIHAHSSKAGMVARLASIFYNPKIVYTPNAFAYLGRRRLKKLLLVLIETMAIPFTDVLLASSKSEANRALNDLHFPKKKVEVYPNSIEILPVDSDYTKTGIKKITTVGRLVNQKNPLMFLRVCKIITDTRNDVMFQIIGAGFEDKLKHKINDFIEKNNLTDKISILPWTDRLNFLQMLKDTSVFVMTSAFESFGYVAAEAQMLQIPVVATNVDGLNEIVENNVTGFLVELNDAQEMAEKILFLIDNPEQAQEMGCKGRLRIEKLFDIRNNIKILEKFYIDQYIL